MTAAPSGLAAQQTALLDLLHLDTIDSVALSADSIRATAHFSLKNPQSTLRGLRAYRANAQATAEAALLASHPVLQQLMGDDNFRNVACDFWQAMPPERGDLAQWGGKLPEYLAQVPQLQTLLQEHPFLLDVARVEWALHVASAAPDAELDAMSFQLLAAHDPALLSLVLSPGSALIRSSFPVVSIIQLHDPRASDAHADAREAIAQVRPQVALVWRRGLRPMVGCADAATAALLEATLQGQPMPEALDAAFAQDTDFNFSAWLAVQVQAGVLLGARLQVSERGNSE